MSERKRRERGARSAECGAAQPSPHPLLRVPRFAFRACAFVSDEKGCAR